MDDAFHQQLESVQAAHQADLLQLAKQKQEEIERANHKVTFLHFYSSVLLPSQETD